MTRLHKRHTCRRRNLLHFAPGPLMQPSHTTPHQKIESAHEKKSMILENLFAATHGMSNNNFRVSKSHVNAICSFLIHCSSRSIISLFFPRANA